MIVLTLPMPPSANHYKKPRKGGGWYLTPEAEAFKLQVKTRARTQGVNGEPIGGEVGVLYAFFRGERNGKLQRGDLFNYEKVLSDALQGIAFRNDSQIRHATLTLREDRKAPRVEVKVWPRGLMTELLLAIPEVDWVEAFAGEGGRWAERVTEAMLRAKETLRKVGK